MTKFFHFECPSLSVTIHVFAMFPGGSGGCVPCGCAINLALDGASILANGVRMLVADADGIRVEGGEPAGWLAPKCG